MNRLTVFWDLMYEDPRTFSAAIPDLREVETAAAYLEQLDLPTDSQRLLGAAYDFQNKVRDVTGADELDDRRIEVIRSAVNLAKLLSSVLRQFDRPSARPPGDGSSGAWRQALLTLGPVGRSDPELAEVMAAWPDLEAATRKEILALVKAHGR